MRKSTKKKVIEHDDDEGQDQEGTPIPLEPCPLPLAI